MRRGRTLEANGSYCRGVLHTEDEFSQLDCFVIVAVAGIFSTPRESNRGGERDEYLAWSAGVVGMLAPSTYFGPCYAFPKEAYPHLELLLNALMIKAFNLVHVLGYVPLSDSLEILAVAR